jgi:hypothetical protein
MTSGGFTTTGMQAMLYQFTLDEVRVVSTVAALASATVVAAAACGLETGLVSSGPAMTPTCSSSTATPAADIGALARPVAVLAGGRRPAGVA